MLKNNGEAEDDNSARSRFKINQKAKIIDLSSPEQQVQSHQTGEYITLVWYYNNIIY